ncbi:MAG: NAD(P)-binding domain-containing protein [Chloroflexi bacterium]|jgi:thioredoxin reductase (NADPH)|nr:NAD(P)-binding domain-containing protein [Chloroflexota bacterium]
MSKNLPIPEIAIIGAGPIGIELAAALKRAGVSTLHFDAKQIGYTLSWWPRQTYFFSTTERIEIAGMPIPNTDQSRVTGEEYLAYLRSIVEVLDLQINTYEPVAQINRLDSGFELVTQSRSGERRYQARRVVLAVGDMHAPNLLHIPGEDLPHVTHYFDEPHTYFREKLLVVGGRNSAAEAALRCWRAGAEVTLSYRRAEFDPKSVKHFILPDLLAQIELGTIKFLPETVPVEITPTQVILRRADDSRFEQSADFALLLTGFLGDMTLFERAGVTLEGESRVPVFDPHTMQTNIPGLYVAGTAAGGERKARYSYFIENCHVHVGRIVQHITGKWPEKLGTIPARQYELPLEDIQAN